MTSESLIFWRRMDETTETRVPSQVRKIYFRDFFKTNPGFHLTLIALYSLIVIIFTWPLSLHLFDQSLRGYDYVIEGVPYDRDQNIWNLWWFYKAFFEFHSNPFHTNYLFYPLGVDLYLHTLSPVNAFMGALVGKWFGWLGAYNFVSLVDFVWCGHAAYLLAVYLTRNKLAAFVAGFFFMLAPQHYFNLHHAQLNVITLQFLPLFLLYFFKLGRLDFRNPWQFLRNKKWWLYTLSCALCLVLTTFADQYILVYSLIIAGLYYLWYGLPFFWRGEWLKPARLLILTLPSMALAGVLILPFLLKTLNSISSGQWVKVSNEAVSMDLVTLFMPPVNNIFLGAKGSEFGQAFFIQPDPRSYSIGLVGLGMALYGAVRCKEARWWGLVLGVAVVLALGAEIRLAAMGTGIPMPGKWLNKLPVLEVMRYSKRWIGPASLAIAVLSAYALHFHLEKIPQTFSSPFKNWKKYGLVLGALGLFMLEAEPWPVALSGDLAKIPEAYTQGILPVTDHKAIFEIPYSQKNSAKAGEMYWQTAHERPIIGGYLSRAYTLNYYDTSLAYLLDYARISQPDFIKIEPARLNSLLANLDFGYVAIYKIKLSPKEEQSWRTFFQSLANPVPPFYEDSQVIFYKVMAPLQPILFTGGGWDNPEKQSGGNYQRWMSGPKGELILNVANPASPRAVVQFEAGAFLRNRTVEEVVNGFVVGKIIVKPEPQFFELKLENQWLKPGDNSIEFRPLEPPDRPADQGQNKDTRPLTIVLRNVSLLV